MGGNVGFLYRFANSERGSLAILSGLSFLVLCLAMGLAYDSSRLNNVTTRVQAALDAAALAGAKMLDDDNSTDSEVINVAQAYFDAHRPDIVMNGLQLPNIVVTPDRSNSSVSVTISGSISSLFGSLAQLSPRLNFTRVSETTYKTKKIELSLVLDITGSMAANGKIDGLKAAAKDLVDTLFATNPNNGAIRLSLVPYSASVNAGSYNSAVTGSSFGSDACVVERSGSQTSTDEPPSSGGYLGKSTLALNPNYFCPIAAVEPLTDLSNASDRNAFKARIDALSPNGGTAGHIGLAWGWYFLSPKWASVWPGDQQPKPASADVTKAVILMTDGAFNTSYLPSNTNSTDYTAAGSSGAQTLALCSAMKMPGSDIQIYTVGFQAPGNAEAMLRSCSGDSNFFDANSSGDLIAAFREIAERLNNLRISS